MVPDRSRFGQDTMTRNIKGGEIMGVYQPEDGNGSGQAPILGLATKNYMARLLSLEGSKIT
jgi:hypothetical protein